MTGVDRKPDTVLDIGGEQVVREGGARQVCGETDEQQEDQSSYLPWTTPDLEKLVHVNFGLWNFYPLPVRGATCKSALEAKLYELPATRSPWTFQAAGD